MTSTNAKKTEELDYIHLSVKKSSLYLFLTNILLFKSFVSL